MPTSSGITADHEAVPAAVPAAPFEVLHVTAATPTLSAAVPASEIAAEDVATIVAAGETIRSEGAIASLDTGGSGADGTAGATGPVGREGPGPAGGGNVVTGFP